MKVKVDLLRLIYHIDVIDDDEKDEGNEIQVDLVFNEEFKSFGCISVVVMDGQLVKGRIVRKGIVNDQVFEFKGFEEYVEVDQN